MRDELNSTIVERVVKASDELMSSKEVYISALLIKRELSYVTVKKHLKKLCKWGILFRIEGDEKGRGRGGVYYLYGSTDSLK